MLVLVAWAMGSLSCGLVRLPFRVAGGVTRGTIHAGESIYQKSKEGIEHRKQRREEPKEGANSANPTGDKDAAGSQNGGLLPDLPENPEDPGPATRPSGTDARPDEVPPGGKTMIEPALPTMPN